MSEYGYDKKQICFDSVVKLHADLKIRLHHDNIKIKEFFNEVVKAYVERDEYLTEFVEKLKEKKKISQNIRNKSLKSRQKQKEIINQFGLNKDEIENIFDIIEKENSEL
jgi:predicted XRE-type DNA-binding protein